LASDSSWTTFPNRRANPILIRVTWPSDLSSGRCASSRHLAEGHPKVLIIESSTRLGRHRWTIERTGAWLSSFRRLRIRSERSSQRVYNLAMLACAVICFTAALQQPPW
jgi:hypothetical protein